MDDFNQLADAVRIILERFMADFPETEFVDDEQR
jgi:hypothetical protein